MSKKTSIFIRFIFLILAIASLFYIFYLTKNNFAYAKILMNDTSDPDNIQTAHLVKYFAYLTFFHWFSFVLIAVEWMNLILHHLENHIHVKEWFSMTGITILQFACCFFSLLFEKTDWLCKYSPFFFGGEIIILFLILLFVREKGKKKKKSSTN